MSRSALFCLAVCLLGCPSPSPSPVDARPDLGVDATDGTVPNDRPTTPSFAVDPDIAAAVEAVSVDEITRTLTALVGFESRNSCSSLSDPARGIGAARDWLSARLGAIAGMQTRVQNYALPDCRAGSTTQSNVIGWIPGATHPERLIVIGGHYDSRGSPDALGAINGEIPAPGANDSGSQTAVLLEAARVLSGRRFDATLVFVAFSGEEQGLYGSAAFVRALPTLFPGASVVAMLNCDIVGGDRDVNDEAALHQFRLYSAGTPRESGGMVTQDPEREGTSDDTSPSRGLMRYVGRWGARYVPAMTMLPRLREDRPGRGGDQSSFVAVRVPAVRLVETHENPTHQHVAKDTLAHATPAYVARIAQVVAAVAASLARAPAAPTIDAVTRDGDALSVSMSPVDPSLRRVLVARPASRNEYTVRIRTTGDEASIRSSIQALGTGDEAFFVSVETEDADGHASLAAYPEWRCDASGCEVQPGSLAITSTRAL